MPFFVHLHGGAISRALADIQARLATIEQKEDKLMSAVDDAVAALQADDATLKTKLDTLSAAVTGFAAQLAAALAAAANAGATPAQLQALTDLHASLQSDIATVDTAIAAVPAP